MTYGEEFCAGVAVGAAGVTGTEMGVGPPATVGLPLFTAAGFVASPSVEDAGGVAAGLGAGAVVGSLAGSTLKGATALVSGRTGSMWISTSDESLAVAGLVGAAAGAAVATCTV